MSGVSEPPRLLIITLRAQIAELGAAIRLLRQAGLDNGAAELLLARKTGRAGRHVVAGKERQV
jgi:hypothetical protein